MAVDVQLIEVGVELATEIAKELAPVIQQWIANGDVSALQSLAKVVPAPSVLAALDKALEEAQRAKALAELGA
jgi:hypothetical protein